MALFAVSSTAVQEDLHPILSFFPFTPRPARAIPSCNQLQGARYIDTPMNEVVKEQARKIIYFSLRHTGGHNRSEGSSQLHRLPASSKVLIYRKTSNHWEGPHRFIDISVEATVIQNPRGRSIYQSTYLKPYLNSQLDPTSRAETSVLVANKKIPDKPMAKKQKSSKIFRSLAKRGTRRTYSKRYVSTCRQTTGTIRNSHLSIQVSQADEEGHLVE